MRLLLLCVPTHIRSCNCRKTAEHVLALVITIGQAIVYVVTGMYGDVGIVNGTLIVAQVSPTGWEIGRKG